MALPIPSGKVLTMYCGLRTHLVVTWCLLGTAVLAQGPLPREEQINPLGLTLQWWGQAVIDRARSEAEFVTADEQNVYIQSNSGVVTAFSLENGRRLWSSLLGAPDRVGYPAATNDEQFLAVIGTNVISVDKMTGAKLWELQLPELPSATPEVDDDMVYVGATDGSVYGFDIHRIRELHQENRLPQWTHLAQVWRRKTPLEITSTPVSTGASVSFSSRAGFVFGVNSRDKQPRYDFHAGGRINTPMGRLGNLIFVAEENGRLYCINQENGQLRWSYISSNPIRHQPRAVMGQVFINPIHRGLEALSVETGYSQWVQPRATEFISASETRVYASDSADNLLILNRQDGHLLASLPFRQFSIRIHNDRTDRIVLSTPDGLILCLREQAADFPTYHLYPERQPILPELAPEEEAAGTPTETTEAAPAN